MIDMVSTGLWPGDKLTYQYDALDRIVNIQPETGQALGMGYDSLGRLSQVITGTDAFAYTFKTATSPLVDRLTRPNGGYTAYQYDNLNRLTAIENKTSADIEITTNRFIYNVQDILETVYLFFKNRYPQNSYTALTRAQQFVFLVGPTKAIKHAVETDKPLGRRSGLSYWLGKASSLEF